MAITGIMSQWWLAKLLIANSSTFQTLVTAQNLTEALDRVALFRVKESEFPLSRARLRGPGAGAEWSRERVGVGTWNTECVIPIIFDLEVTAPEDTVEDQACWWMTQVGAIVKDMENAVNARAQINGEDPLAVEGFALVEGPVPVRPDEVKTDHPLTRRKHPAWTGTVLLTM